VKMLIIAVTESAIEITTNGVVKRKQVKVSMQALDRDALLSFVAEDNFKGKVGDVFEIEMKGLT